MIPVTKTKCGSCPFRRDSQYRYLVDDLTASALSEGSRICHNTGENGIGGKTGKPERLCRGARDVQLEVFASIGFISAATDEAWRQQCERMGLS